MIAVELLQLTYLHGTQPSVSAIEILNPLELTQDFKYTGTVARLVNVPSLVGSWFAYQIFFLNLINVFKNTVN